MHIPSQQIILYDDIYINFIKTQSQIWIAFGWFRIRGIPLKRLTHCQPQPFKTNQSLLILNLGLRRSLNAQ